jgi:hypothetical protein
MSTPGEERWGKTEEKVEAFSITQVKDIGVKLVCLRSPLQKFEWTGDFCKDSPSWTKEILSHFEPKTEHFDPLNPENDDNIFWMSYEDMLKQFASLNVCKAVNMHEIRIKGKFLRMQDINDPFLETIISKWYYNLEVYETNKVWVTVHQEDERRLGILARKPYIDIGIAVLRRTNEGLKLIGLRDF